MTGTVISKARGVKKRPISGITKIMTPVISGILGRCVSGLGLLSPLTMKPVSASPPIIRCEKIPTAVPSKRRPTYATTLPTFGARLLGGVVMMMSPGLIAEKTAKVRRVKANT